MGLEEIDDEEHQDGLAGQHGQDRPDDARAVSEEAGDLHGPRRMPEKE
jgi:hypothetical protein